MTGSSLPEMFAEKDLEFLSSRALQLEASIRGAATSYITTVLAVLAAIAGIGAIMTDGSKDAITDIIGRFNAALASIGILVVALGFLHTLIVARDRRHYHRIVGLFNRLRNFHSASTNTREHFALIWLDETFPLWSWNSAATLNLVALAMPMYAILFACLWLYGFTMLGIILLTVIIFTANLLLVVGFSK